MSLQCAEARLLPSRTLRTPSLALLLLTSTLPALAQSSRDDAPIAYPAQSPRTNAPSSNTRFGFVSEEDKVRLDDALDRFSKTAWLHRSAGRKGRPMSALQLANWRELMRETERFLEAGVTPSSDQRMLKLRATFEKELEADAATYAQIPPSLVDDVMEHETKLGLRMARIQKAAEERHTASPTTRSFASRFGFIWPVMPIRINSLFGRRFHPILKRYKEHMGLDLAAYKGQDIRAAKAGVILSARNNGGHGLQVRVDHGDGTITSYSHCSKLIVREGQSVGQGDRLALAGSTGASTGPHLHFEILRRGLAVDPLSMLGLPSESDVKTVAGTLEQ